MGLKNKTMNNKQQTAVRWLICELIEYGLINKDMLPSHPIFNKAKQLEKQQIMNAASWMPKPFDNMEFLPELAEQYYNETYGGQNNEQ